MAVKNLREAFGKTLADWAATRGFPDEKARLDANGEVALTLGNAVGTLVYRDASDTVIFWLESGPYRVPEAPRGALTANDRFALTRGFTLAIDPKTDRLMVHDRRPAERLLTVAALEAWLTAGCELAAEVREVALYGIENVVECD